MELKIQQRTMLWVIAWALVGALFVLAFSGCKNDSRSNVTISDPAFYPSITCEYFVQVIKKIGCKPAVEHPAGVVTVDILTDSTPTFLFRSDTKEETLVVSGHYIFETKEHGVVVFQLKQEDVVIASCSVLTLSRKERS
jgi:hypothetical protein